MKVLIQRVKEAQVTVSDEVIGKIGPGYVCLTGFTHDDTSETALKAAQKVYELRLFNDADGKMNLPITEVGGEVLAISQFTLYGDTKKGRRPSFVKAMASAAAEGLMTYFVEALRALGLRVETGQFGAQMEVSLINDGPVTIEVVI